MSGENTAAVGTQKDTDTTAENITAESDFNESAFFEDENISEDELMGTEETSESDSSKEESEENSESEQSASEENAGTDDSSDKEDSEETNQEEENEEVNKEGDEDKPPKGFVPHQALNQERVRRQELARENADLKARLLEQEQAKLKDLPKEFEFKSEEELAELMEEDPTAALAYIRQEQKAFFARNQSDRAQQIESELKVETEYLVNSAWEDMQESIPELFDPKSSNDYNNKLTDFAVKNGGFKKTDLALLTNPETRFLTPDGQVQIFGPIAAGITKMINNSFKASDSTDLRKEIETELRQQITQDLISKFKSSGGSPDFKSLEQAPSRGKEVSSAPASEDDWMSLSDEEEERLLRNN